MDKPNHDFGAGEWPFPWDPYLDLRQDAPSARTEEPTPTTKRSSLPPPSAAEASRKAATRAEEPAPSASAPNSVTRRRRPSSRWEAMSELSPKTHHGVEPPARAATSRTITWVVTLGAAVGLLIWLGLKLPSFAMDERHRLANEASMAKSRVALAGRATKPLPTATELACTPPATTRPAGPGAPPPDATARQAGMAAGAAIAAKDPAGKTTTVKETKPGIRRASPLRPSSPAKAPASRPAMASPMDPVYPEPEPIRPAPPAAEDEGEIFNRPPSPN